PTWAAVVIGVVSGFIVMYGIKFNDWVLKVDDPVGAVAVHGYNGLWGLLTVGIFADGTYGGVSGLIVGNTSQIIAQLIDMVVVVVWAFGTGYILFYIIKKIVGLRVSPEEELTGLDLGEHGYSAYPEFVIAGPMDGLREGQISDNLECSTEGART